MNQKFRSNGEFIQFLIELNRKLSSPETIINKSLSNEANLSILIRDTPISGPRLFVSYLKGLRHIALREDCSPEALFLLSKKRSYLGNRTYETFTSLFASTPVVVRCPIPSHRNILVPGKTFF